MKKATVLFLTSCLLTLAACTSIDCPLDHLVMTKYALKQPDLTTDTLKDTLNITTRQMDGKDTLLLNKGIGLTNFSVTVSYTNPEDTLCFKFSNVGYFAVDTVWVKKEDTPHFESVDCTPTYYHNITAVRSTHYAIDSVIINNPTVDYDPQKVHFHLYLKSRD